MADKTGPSINIGRPAKLTFANASEALQWIQNELAAWARLEQIPEDAHRFVGRMPSATRERLNGVRGKLSRGRVMPLIENLWNVQCGVRSVSPTPLSWLLDRSDK